MARPEYDAALIEAVLAAYLELGSAAAAGRRLGIGKRRAQRIVKRAAMTGEFGYNPIPEHAKAPPSMSLKGVSQLVRDPAEGPRGDKEARGDQRREEAIAGIREAFEDLRGTAAPPPSILPTAPAPLGYDPADCHVADVLPDLHIGMRSHGAETGEDFDLTIAVDQYAEAYATLRARIPAGIPSASVLFLGDIFHANSQIPHAQRSSNLFDMDGRWRKVFREGAKLACFMLELATDKHADVECVVLPGNHDHDAARVLDVALELRYADHPIRINGGCSIRRHGSTLIGGRVDVPGTWGHHWVRRHGSTLLAATHGHTLKPPRMAQMLADDYRLDWGECEHVHVLYGHTHHQKMEQIGRVRVEGFEAPCARSSYSAACGYTSGRSLTSIVYHRTEGEIARFRVPVGRQR